MKTPLLVVLASLVFLPSIGQAENSLRASEPDQRALPLTAPDVTPYGARMRVTKTAWDFVMLTLRDNFKEWGQPGSLDGANLLLDPGYDHENPGNAGLIRTSPFLWDWLRYDSVISRSNQTQSCPEGINCICGGCNDSRYCGRSCSKSLQAPATRWLQVRRPGAAITSNQPVVPAVARPTFRERGFYVADEGDDFKQMQFCTNRGGDGDFYYDSGSGKSGRCDTPHITFEVGCCGFTTDVRFYYNVRLFIFPNMRTEYMGSHATYPRDPAHGWENWDPTTRRGPYSRLASNFGDPPNSHIARTVSTVTDCNQGSAGYCSSSSTNCCCSWCLCTCRTHTAHCYSANTSMYRNVYHYPIGSGTSTWLRSLNFGSYVRAGDDQALYTNIGEMQIQSVNRPTFNGTANRACQNEIYYTGLETHPSSADPEMGTNAKIANCMIPKSYWDVDESQWVACNPFDTWNADGTYNMDNDDAKWMYPGHPDTGRSNADGSGDLISPGRCGGQTACTGPACGNPPSTRRTTSFRDLFDPGGGWYFLGINDIRMIPGSSTITGDPDTHPRMEVELEIPDVRVEVGAAITVRAEGTLVVNETYRNIRALGQIKFDAINVKASIRMFSTDDQSCVPGITNAATCTDPYRAVNNNLLTPDKVLFDISIDEFTIDSPDPWYVGECDNVTIVLLRALGTDWITATVSACDVLNDDLVIWGINVGSVGIKDMLTEIVEDALQDEIKDALADFAAAVPNLNSILGDPINIMNRSLVETGIYAAGGLNDRVLMNDGTVRWPLHMLPGPEPDREITDLRLSLGFLPMAFRPPTGYYDVMDQDTADVPQPDSVYGVPTLMNPDITGCGADCAERVEYDENGASFDPGVLPYPDSNQQYDSDDHIVGASGGTYLDPKSLQSVSLGQYERIPEFWQGPIPEGRKPPAWCSSFSDQNIGAPTVLRDGGGSSTDFQALYPQNTWLSFDPSLDSRPAGSGLVTPGQRNTFGGWDSMDPGTVLMQNRNDGSLEPDNVPYDFSLHVHQRTIAQFLQAVVASGAMCLEFASTDEEGNDTPFNSLLSTDIFAALLPDLYREYPGKGMKVQISPTGTPRVRTGMGQLEYTPEIKGMDIPAGEEPLPIGPTSYMLSIAFPDTRIEFLVEHDDPDIDDVSILTMYWTPVIGFHMQSVRRCYYLDPILDSDEPEKCTSSFVNVRTVSGYNEIYVDIGSSSLQEAWVNPQDFPEGYFDDIGRQRFFGAGDDVEKSHIVIESTYCGVGCDQLALSALVPTLMDSFISLFVVSRFSFLNLTLDLLYTGVDGPNDDGIGEGDYLGIYARFLGNLDLFSLLEGMDGMFSPEDGREPLAFVPGMTEEQVPEVKWFNTRHPVFPVETIKQFEGEDVASDIAFTYSLNDGFWRTPDNTPELALGPLWEGEHKLSLRAVEYTAYGATASLEPVDVRFRVDTLPPEVTIRPSSTGNYEHRVIVDVEDLQTPHDELVTHYQWNEDAWLLLDGPSLSTRNLVDGSHTLRVRSTDLAGNVGESVRQITVGDRNWWQRIGCSQQGAGPGLGWLLLLLAFLPPAYRAFRFRKQE